MMLAAFTLWTIMLNLLILVAVIAGAVAAMLYASLHRLSHVKVQPCPSEGEPRAPTPPPGKTTIWADAGKFRFLGNYELAGTSIAAWQHTAKPALFCEYTTKGKTTCDFVTAFADGVWLTTSSAPDSESFPKPAGKYSQTYPGLDLADLWHAPYRHGDLPHPARQPAQPDQPAPRRDHEPGDAGADRPRPVAVSGPSARSGGTSSASISEPACRSWTSIISAGSACRTSCQPEPTALRREPGRWQFKHSTRPGLVTVPHQHTGRSPGYGERGHRIAS